jgi:hypothetical protein
MAKIFAVDLDGVIAQYSGWKGLNSIGEPIPGAKEFLTELRKKGHVKIFTTRTSKKLHGKPSEELVGIIKRYMKKYELPYDSIFDGDKPMYSAIIDDRAINANPQKYGKKVYAKIVVDL